MSSPTVETGSSAFTERIETQGFSDHDRLMVALITVRSILSAPFAGYGYGSFASTFPMFRDSSLDVWHFWDKAHNTYLEVLQGLGLVFGAMLIGSVLVLVVCCLKGAIVRHRDATAQMAAVSASFVVGIHALVDFSLQIQAVTLTYMAVLGAGVAQTIVSRVGNFGATGTSTTQSGLGNFEGITTE